MKFFLNYFLIKFEKYQRAILGPSSPDSVSIFEKKKVDCDQNKINLGDKLWFEKVYWNCYYIINKTSSTLKLLIPSVLATFSSSLTIRVNTVTNMETQIVRTLLFWPNMQKYEILHKTYI